jgi:hypothetical protein
VRGAIDAGGMGINHFSAATLRGPAGAW